MANQVFVRSFLAIFAANALVASALAGSAVRCEDLVNQTQTEVELRENAKANLVGVVDQTGNRLKYDSIVNISDYKGRTFFSLMKDVIKPKLDEFGNKGFLIRDSKSVLVTLKNVTPKVSSSAIKAAGSQENLLKIADTLAATGKKYSLYDLPAAIAKIDPKVSRYDLSTFFSLESGGGVGVQLTDCDMCYNVNYGDGTHPKDEMTGRSFGQGPERGADDASDKSYLAEIESKVVRSEDIEPFYKSIMLVLTDCDSSALKKLPKEQQDAAADFFAILIAETARHLMSDLKSHAWDVALVQTTLLGAFHSGQDKIAIMYQGKMSEKVPGQAPGGKPKGPVRQASMIDYWQFSPNAGPNANRSGINETRRDFLATGKAITSFIADKNPALLKSVESHFKGVTLSGNVFDELTSFLINYKTPQSLNTESEKLATDMTAFLMEARKNANAITKKLLAD